MSVATAKICELNTQVQYLEQSPDYVQHLETEKVRENNATLAEVRLVMAKMLDANPKGAPTPDFGLE